MFEYVLIGDEVMKLSRWAVDLSTSRLSGVRVRFVNRHCDGIPNQIKSFNASWSTQIFLTNMA